MLWSVQGLQPQNVVDNSFPKDPTEQCHGLSWYHAPPSAAFRDDMLRYAVHEMPSAAQSDPPQVWLHAPCFVPDVLYNLVLLCSTESCVRNPEETAVGVMVVALSSENM